MIPFVIVCRWRYIIFNRSISILFVLFTEPEVMVNTVNACTVTENESHIDNIFFRLNKQNKKK